MRRLAPIAICLVAVGCWGGSMAATSSAKSLTFLPCALLPSAPFSATSRFQEAWVLMPHPPECTEYRGARTPENEVPLEDIHWHHWGAQHAVGHGRWLTSAEFGAEKSAPVTLTAYRLFDSPKCIFGAGGYTRLKVEAEDPELPARVVIELPPCFQSPTGKPAQEIGGKAHS